MKCPKCSAEWHLSENMPVQPKACPFCGESLQTAPADSLVTIVRCFILWYFRVKFYLNYEQKIIF